MNHTIHTKYLIVGAGISGLSCAAQLAGEDYCILEKEQEVGGYCRTFHQSGFTWDFAGHFFHFRDSEIEAEFADLLHADDSVENRKNTKIYYKDRYIDYPFQYNIHQLEKDEFIDCLVGLYQNSSEEAQNFKEMILQKYGSGIADKFLIPYNSKLYACDLNMLDMNAMGRFFPYANPEEIIRGFRQKRPETYNDTFFYSKRGAEAFVHKIAELVEAERILCHTELLKVDSAQKVAYTTGGSIHYEYLISTIPFDCLLDITQTCHSRKYSSNQVLVFNMGFDKPAQDRSLHWVYYPQKDISFYRVGFYSNILHEDRLSIYVELGFPSAVEVDVDFWQTRVLDDLRRVGILSNHRLIAQNALLMNPAYVHICGDSEEEKEKLKEQLEKQQIYVTGRYGDWKYCSIEDCIIQARDMVKKITLRK